MSSPSASLLHASATHIYQKLICLLNLETISRWNRNQNARASHNIGLRKTDFSYNNGVLTGSREKEKKGELACVLRQSMLLSFFSPFLSTHFPTSVEQIILVADG